MFDRSDGESFLYFEEGEEGLAFLTTNLRMVRYPHNTIR